MRKPRPKFLNGRVQKLPLVSQPREQRVMVRLVSAAPTDDHVAVILHDAAKVGGVAHCAERRSGS